MTTVKQLLEEKGHQVWSVHPDDTVFDAIKKMADHGVGALLVTEADTVVGILTERHYARNVILKGRASPYTAVRDIMAKPVMCARPEFTVEECMALMTDKRIRHLPVIEQQRLIGIVSIGDLVRSVIAEQQFTIEQLRHYVYD